MASGKLSFGTGGIRGIRGSGENQFNEPVVLRVAYGHARFLQKQHRNMNVQNLKFAIAFDARHKSKEFAHLYAKVFAEQGFAVRLFTEPRPTPFLSYWIKKESCVGGVCITASHNPAEYSGIKVYGSTGGQVVAPEDTQLVSVIESFEGEKLDRPQEQAGLVEFVGSEMDGPYLSAVSSELPLEVKDPGFDVAFTALHGCGGALFERLYKKQFKRKLLFVCEQQEPNGDFPSVVQPNPEVRSTMKLVEKLGKEKNCELVLATDGDGDRIGFAEWDKSNADYWYPTGNEILVLLTDFLLASRKRKSDDDYCVKTIVSTELLNLVAKKHEVSCVSTLTGFKWIVDYIVKQKDERFICGGEESFGFLPGLSVADKDGMSSLALIVQLKMHCSEQGFSIQQKMENIYTEHGYFFDHVDSRVFKTADSLAQVSQGLAALRQNLPAVIAGYEVEKVWDLQNDQYGACELSAGEGGFAFAGSLNMPVSNVLQFYLANGSKISIRPSGTEPKMKVYYSLPDAIAGGNKEVLGEKFADIQSHVWSLLGDSRDDSQGVGS